MANAASQQTPTIDAITGHLLAELQRIRQVLDVLPLPEETTTVAHRELSATEVDLLSAEPDRTRIAASAKCLALELCRSGALDHAGHALTGPLGTLADWLGDTGLPIRRLLS
ncbi:hypothetical protein GCM10025331_44200 [Actinoplanes utahensis]|nr:hypothetical protein Aut01nite_28890 [Actinoplanes utahensis]